MTGFFDPLACGIVLGGSLAAAAMRSTGEDIVRALAALGPLMTASPARDGEAAAQAVGRIQRATEVRDLICADRIDTAQPFLKSCARRLSELGSARAFAIWAEEDLAGRAERHIAAQAFWRTVADTAPAMGLLATILGLIAMFARMDDPARIGPAMAMALLATLYGVIVANLIAGPIAARLERLSAAETAWQRRAVDRLVRLAEAEWSAPVTPLVRRDRAA